MVKDATNEYSKYDYFTPTMVQDLVNLACKDAGILTVCNLKADEYGLFQEMILCDLEGEEEELKFELRTKHGTVTATNDTQAMGSTDTYSERYIKMKVFEIKENNLDVDAQDSRPQTIDQFKAEVNKMTDLDKVRTYYKSNAKTQEMKDVCKARAMELADDIPIVK